MIKNGDIFTHRELTESVDQITSADIRPHLVYDKSNIMYVDGDTFINLMDWTPESYAQYKIDTYADIPSSAVALDKSLRDNGFRTTYKFAHKYCIPGISPERVVRDAYKLEYFYKLATGPIQIRRGHKTPVQTKIDAATRHSYYYAQYIWSANPMARFDYAEKIHMYRDWGLVLSFLIGTGYGFHPNDVYEFVMHHNDPKLTAAGRRESYERQLAFKNWCMNKHNVDTGCLVLSPEHQEKLRRILTRSDTPYAIQLIQKLFKPGKQY